MNKTKLFAMLILALSLFAVASCNSDDDPVPVPTLSVEPLAESVDFAAAGETKAFTVTTNQKGWAVNSNQTWLTATATATGFTLTAAANPASTPQPVATVTVMAPGCDIITFTATQAGNVTFNLPDGYMVSVEAGVFQMGAPATDEGAWEGAFSMYKPQHQVTLTKNYYIGKYEVTKGLWAEVMGEPAPDAEQANIPVTDVSYYAVQQFLTTLNGLTGKNYRLPTEAEWEFAARGGKQSKGYMYSGSNDPTLVAYNGPTNEWNVWAPTAVGTLAPNELGLYDMSGNVWEWCSDWYDVYTADAQTDPTGPATGTERVGRGGAYDSNNESSRVYSRASWGQGYSSSNRGFRIALSAE